MGPHSYMRSVGDRTSLCGAYMYFTNYAASSAALLSSSRRSYLRGLGNKADSHIACCSHAVPLSCRAAKGLQGHSIARPSRDGRAVALKRTARSEHGMASVNQTRPHCVNQMGKTFQTLTGTAWQGNGMGAGWERNAMCESALILSFPRSNVLGCVPTIRVEPSPVSVAKTRQRLFGLTYYGCVQECVHTSNVEYHETFSVKSLDAACYIFVSADP